MFYQLTFPPLPTYNQGGKALFQIGDNHPYRTNLGVFDLMLVESGCLYIQDGLKRYVVKAQESILLHPHQTHSSFKPCDTSSHIHWLHFDFAGDFTRETSLKHIREDQLALPIHQQFSASDFTQLVHWADNLADWLSDPAVKGKMTLRNHPPLSQLDKNIVLLKLLRLLSRRTPSSSSQPNKDIASQVKQYLLLNYPYEITLAELALHSHCHESQVIRSFRHRYGTTPFKELQNIRLTQAEKLLKESTFSIANVALTTGFNSPAYFAKCFREHYGMPPATYRKQFATLINNVE